MNRLFSPRPSLTLLFLFLAWTAPLQAGPPAADAYDRLDGTGESRKKVNVIEWEGNLEIHVYPAGSLKGLALKIDDRDKAKTVMVIGYRFDNAPQKQLIRRAILGIDLKEGAYHVYRDSTAQGYDKVVITPHLLNASYLTAFKLDPPPKQLYPDGHPALLAEQQQKDPRKAEEPRRPASEDSEHVPGGTVDQDTGTIKPFKW